MKRLFFVTAYFVFFSFNLFGQSWIHTDIGAGSKSDIVVDTSGVVHIAYLNENTDLGYAVYGTLDPLTGTYIEERITDGTYVFGPISLGLMSNGTPVVSYVNIESPNLAGIDAEISTKGMTGWTAQNITVSGPSGFDLSMVLVNEIPNVVAMNPGAMSVTFHELNSSPTTESVFMTTGIVNDYGTAIAEDPNGSIGICYTIADTSLQYAIKIGSSWISQNVASNSSNPDLVFSSTGQAIIAYYETNRDTAGTILKNGSIKIARLMSNNWVSETIEDIDGIDLGLTTGAQKLLDLEIASDGSLHLVYVSGSTVKYATNSTGTWVSSIVNDFAGTGLTLGQQASLALDKDNTPHVSYFTTDGQVRYSVFGEVEVNTFTIECPRDTILNCAIGPMNMAYMDSAIVVGGVATLSFTDSIIQDCPLDRIVQRTWVATDSITSDSCIVMITVENGAIEDIGVNQDTLSFDGLCFTEIMNTVTDSINLSCNSKVDSIKLNTDLYTCDSLIMTRTWYINELCLDTLIEVNQTILGTNIPSIALSDTTIVGSPMSDSTGSIAVALSCMDDSLSYVWSNGSTNDSLLGVAAGMYQLTLSNDRGCVDSFTFEIPIMEIPDSLTFLCPADTIISCEFLIIPEFTGVPVTVGYDTTFFSDNMIQDCPMDIILERTWVAQKDTSRSDTCIQMITYQVDTSLFVIQDTLLLDSVCVDDLSIAIRENLDLPCSITVDSIGIVMNSNTCDTINLTASWKFEVGCADSLVTGTQTIIITNPILVTFDEPLVVLDSASQTASIALDTLCSRDSLTFAWSTGSDSLQLTDLVAGTYTLTVTNNQGCIDSFSYTIPEFNVDTVMLSLACPVDTTLSCDSATDPSITGMATVMGYDSLMFIDVVQDTCPNDIIITRQWIASLDSTSRDTCTQTIIVLRDGLSKISAPDTISFSGLCAEEIAEALLIDTLSLSCGVVIDTIITTADSINASFENYTRTWTFIDACADDTLVVSQALLFTNIPTIKINNIAITADSGDSTGMVAYDILCAPDSLSFSWSNGSTDTLLSMVPAGEYQLVVSDTAGVVDSFSFTVVLMMDSTMFALNCPADTMVLCDSGTDPSITGMATIMGYDSLMFIDVVQDTCPNDIIITRQWIASLDSTSRDTCTQTITVLRDGLSKISAPDTISFTGLCAEEIAEALLIDTLSLSCGVVIDTIITTADSINASFENYTRTWTFIDVCADDTLIVSQALLFTNIPTIKIDNITITADSGDSTGMIAYDIVCAPDSLSFNWSNGSTDTLLSMVPAGEYQLVVSDTAGVVDSFNFTVELMMDTTFTLVCPVDTMISCDSSIDPAITGMPTIIGYDSIAFTDMVLDTCPNDIIITRQWIATGASTESDTCLQTITVLRNGLSTISAPDTVSFTGLCVDEIAEALIIDTLSLSCGVTIDTIVTTADSINSSFENYTRTWTFIDACADDTLIVTQALLFSDIPALKIDNIAITPDNGDTTGTISYDIVCAPDSLSFSWSNGSTDTLLTMLAAGDYTLTVSDTAGVVDSFLFNVPFMMDSTMFSLLCPSDTTISCDSATDPSITGMATIMGYDSLTFVDMVQDTCPDDIIITRQWIASLDSTSTDTCTQIITVLRDGLSKITAPDTVIVEGLCPEEIAEALMIDTLSLSCGVMIDTIITTADSINASFENYTRTWTFIDACADDTLVVSQALLFTDIQAIKIENIEITPDNGDSTGTISYDITCAADSLSFSWSNGSTDTLQTMLAAGDYILTVSDTAGIVDSFNFTVPFMMDSIMFSLACPADTTISCDSATDPSITGMATIAGYDSLTFVDVVQDTCPNDIIITRQWIATLDSTNTDTCTQTITVLRDGLSKVVVENSLLLSGVCLAEVMSGSIDTFDLGCGVVLDTIIIDIDSETCDTATLTRSFTFRDACTDSTLTLFQSVTLTDIPVAQILNETIVGDVGDSLGTIDLELETCKGDLSYLWSTGDTTLSIDSLKEGSYSLTVTNGMNCVDSFQFELPFVDTTAFFISINDRSSIGIDVDTISVRRSNGAVVRSEVTRISRGQYSFTSPQTIIAGDQVCMDIDDNAGRDISVLDLVKGQRHILGLAVLCADDQLAADINFSGNISGADLAGIQRVILDIDSSFPDGRTWIFTGETTSNPDDRKDGCVSLSANNVENRAAVFKALKLGNLICDEE